MVQFQRKAEYRSELENFSARIVAFYRSEESSFECARFLKDHGVPLGDDPPFIHGEPYFETLKAVMWDGLGEDPDGLRLLPQVMLGSVMAKDSGLMVLEIIRKTHPHFFSWLPKSVIDDLINKFGVVDFFSDANEHT